MSAVVKSVSEQNSAQSKEAASAPTQPVEDTSINNVETSVPGGDIDYSAAEKSTSPNVDNKKTPVKRTPSKRMSFIQRAQKESEELVKNMGGSLEIEGGRRTRSSTRGTPTKSVAASTPPPTKKARNSPASGASTPTRSRGRGRKIDISADAAEGDEDKSAASGNKMPLKVTQVIAKDFGEPKEAQDEKPVDENAQEKEEKQDSSEFKNVPASDEKKNLTTEVVVQPDEDKTDSVSVPIVEETKNLVATSSLPIGENATKAAENKTVPVQLISGVSVSAKSVSPMDVEAIEDLTEETLTATAEKLKEPTPEPMEIDSSPNVDGDVAEINSESNTVEEKIVKIVEEQQSTSEVTTAKISVLASNTPNVEENVKENSAAAIPIVTSPAADIVANNSIEKSATVIEVTNTNENTNTVVANDVTKTENDLCEPKIATSPPISAANDKSAVTTTPQTCN